MGSFSTHKGNNGVAMAVLSPDELAIENMITLCDGGRKKRGVCSITDELLLSRGSLQQKKPSFWCSTFFFYPCPKI